MKMRTIVIFLIASVAFVGLTAATWTGSDNSAEFLNNRAELLLRDIGHRTLQYAGDSVSRVMPVERLSESIFMITFEKSFSFSPDSLVKIVDKSLSQAEMPLSYRVNVFDCKYDKLVYGFEISKRSEVVPCLGRVQPVDCYKLQVVFLDFPRESGVNKVLLGSSALIAVAFGFVLLRRRGSVTDEKEPKASSGGDLFISIGQYKFQAERKLLLINEERIELSDKETQILSIFAASLNQPISRDRIMKEVWEDEGVIVGRSLDVFVSKLRKKLQKDPSLRIVNIHGKGYKLEVD
jgi:hypothetical protein